MVTVGHIKVVAKKLQNNFWSQNYSIFCSNKKVSPVVPVPQSSLIRYSQGSLHQLMIATTWLGLGVFGTSSLKLVKMKPWNHIAFEFDHILRKAKISSRNHCGKTLLKYLILSMCLFRWIEIFSVVFRQTEDLQAKTSNKRNKKIF